MGSLLLAFIHSLRASAFGLAQHKERLWTW
jgi:hypothetical protein